MGLYTVEWELPFIKLFGVRSTSPGRLTDGSPMFAKIHQELTSALCDLWFVVAALRRFLLKTSQD